jgi:hypothetical protein
MVSETSRRNPVVIAASFFWRPRLRRSIRGGVLKFDFNHTARAAGRIGSAARRGKATQDLPMTHKICPEFLHRTANM